MTVGARIKERMDELKIDMLELSRRTGIPRSTLYGIAADAQRGSTRLHDIAGALGLHTRWLAGKEGPRLLSDKSTVPAESIKVYGLPISAEEAELGREWGKLEEPMRTFLANQIRAAVAEQKRTQRKTKDRPAREAERSAYRDR